MSRDAEQVVSFSGRSPRIGRDVYLAPGARVVGDVTLGERVSVWFNAVLRADMDRIEVGDGTNIQDNCTLHVDDDLPCLVGRDVVVGHAAVLHACVVGDEALVGMGSVVLSGARVGRRAVVAAGAVVPEYMHVPESHVVMGVGGKVLKPLPADFWTTRPLAASKYRRLAESYLRGTPYRWPDPDWDARDAEEIRRRP
jgi:carbonic anhydrase/acetyltransferase-like protein (isoleucine patch superfamily)